MDAMEQTGSVADLKPRDNGTDGERMPVVGPASPCVASRWVLRLASAHSNYTPVIGSWASFSLQGFRRFTAGAICRL